MPITTSYPGVYIEEDSAPSLSMVSGATAVPLFAVGDDDLLYTDDDGTPGLFNSMTRISSWFDYQNLRAGKFKSNSHIDISIRAYFMNGGGYCYIVNDDQIVSECPKYSDITLIVAAGIDIHDAINTLCVPGSGLFALTDGPQGKIDSATIPDYTNPAFGAVYYPWFNGGWTSTNLPPSAIMAGIYCANDRSRGAWKAPANIVVQVADAKPMYSVTDDQQGQYNTGKAINMIRTLNNRGLMVWGARTLEDSDDWRYIPVRRLFNSAERDIQQAMQTMVFETNNAPTWEKVRTAITNYLHNLWQQGALVGTTEKEAYFVQVGEGTTMNSDDIAQGKMIVKVGMAAVRPAEFIILQFTQNIEQS